MPSFRPMREQLHVVLTVARDRTMARISVAYLGYNMAEHATWIAIIVYAYGIGGAGFAGFAALIQLVPAGFIAPFAAYAGDRFRHDRMLVVGYAIQALTMAATAAALYLETPVAVTLLVATSAAIAVTLTRPVQGVLLPAITHSPADLTAANTVSGLVEGVGLFLGPLVAGLLLVRSEPGDVFAAFAAWSVANVLLVCRLEVVPGHIHAEPNSARELIREVFGGVTSVRRDRGVLAIVSLLTMAMVVFGALDILYVAVAIDLFAAGESWAGYLYAAFGLGAIGGVFWAVRLVGRRRLTPAFAASGLINGLAVAAVAAVPGVGAAVAMLALSGAASTVNTVAGRSLLQRAAPEAILARVFGLLEGLAMFALALGSIVTGLIIQAVDIRTALVIAGLTLPLLTLATWRHLGSIDRHAKAPDPEALTLLQQLPIFAPLSAPSMERILAELTWAEAPAGHVLIREGDLGRHFYVLAEGRVRVSQGEMDLGARGPGAGLGEIALLRDVPRTATVTALTPLRYLTIERGRFLEAVTGHFESRREVEQMADRHVGGTVGGTA